MDMMNSIINIGAFDFDFDLHFSDDDCCRADGENDAIINFGLKDSGGVLYMRKDSGAPLEELLSESEKADLLGWLIRFFATLRSEGYASFAIDEPEEWYSAVSTWITMAKCDDFDMDFSDAAVATYNLLLKTKIVIISKYRVLRHCGHCPDRFTCDYYGSPEKECFGLK